MTGPGAIMATVRHCPFEEVPCRRPLGTPALNNIKYKITVPILTNKLTKQRLICWKIDRILKKKQKHTNIPLENWPTPLIEIIQDSEISRFYTYI